MSKLGSANLIGMKELESALVEISAAAARGVLKRALSAAAKPIAQSMSDLAPIHSGSLSESPRIEGDVRGGVAGRRAFAAAMAAGEGRRQAQAALRAANKANPRQFQASADIGPDKSAGHAHLVEFGTGPRHHKDGRFVGAMPADPFIRPAWDREGGDKAQQRMSAALQAELTKAIRRARARAVKP